MPAISIVILTYNSSKFISECLAAVFMQDCRDFEVIVVDNGSKDGTVSFVKETYPMIRLIENKINLGAAGARNQGINIAKGEWVLTLDCDVVLEKGFLSSMEKAVKEAAPDVGMIQPKILQAGRKTVYSTGIFLSSLRRFNDIGKGGINSGRFGKTKYLFGVCSAAAFYNKKMLETIMEDSGYFDERFFFLFEDVDLSWRAGRKGWRALFCPNAVCYHHGNSSATPKKVRQYLCLRNRYYTLLKNDSIINYILPFLFYDLPRLLWISIINPSALKAIRDAFIYKDYLRHIKREP